jgi:lipid kinase, YegS/Rv2252/BmrU family
MPRKFCKSITFAMFLRKNKDEILMTDNRIRIQAIINPISGVGSKRKIPKMLEKHCCEKDYDLTISFTEYAGHASELTKKALEDGAKCVIAVGGDGTINEVACAMIHSEAVLGIIPKGSGNGLAHELQIPMDTKRAIDVILRGFISKIDACKANERIFFCTCGLGFDAEVSDKFAKEKRRGSLTYIKDTIMEYLKYKPEPYELLIDDLSIKEKAFLIACGNASQYGNNAFIAPNADIKDGQLDVTMLSPFTPLDVAPLAIQLFTKQIDKNSKIKTFRAKKITIIRENPGLMHLDGDPVMVDSRVDIAIIPKALNVLVPETVSLSDEVRNLFDDMLRFFR